MKPKIQFKTEDGYTFYLHASGKVTDSLSRSGEDMAWPNLSAFLLDMHQQEMPLALMGEADGTYFRFGMLPAKPR